MSTLDIKFTAIASGPSSSYYCYMCQLDGFNILLDCGWNFDVDSCLTNNLKEYCDSIDLILISGSSVKHVAGLAYMYTRNSWKCPIYMTQPVWQASKLTMYDYYQALFNCKPNEKLPFTLDDVDNVWDSVTRVRYLQCVYLKGRGQGITLLALNSGMTLGSCMWRISKENEGEIVYAVQINHKKQLHLNEAMIHGLIKPFIFITDASEHTKEPQNKKAKVQKLTSEILKVLSSNNGSVLMFSDTAGQVIELLFLLSSILRANKYTCIDVIVCSHVAHHILKLVTSNTEWLNEKLMKKMEAGVFNFLGLLNLYTCQTINEVDHLKSARIIITSNINMEYSMGVQLFSRMASDPNNLLVYTIPPDELSLAEQVIENSPDSDIKFKVSTKVQLKGRELDDAFDVINQNRTNQVSTLDNSENSSDDENTLLDSEFPHNTSFNSTQTDELQSRAHTMVDTEIRPPVDNGSATENVCSIPNGNESELSVDYILGLLENRYGASFPNNSRNSLKPMQTTSNSRFKKPYDVYGEIYKHEGFVKNVIQEKHIISYDDKQMKSAYDHAEIDITKYPSKILTTQFNQFQVKAKILFINLNCAIDCVSQTRMIESIQPRHLIIVSNGIGDTQFLEDSINKVAEKNGCDANRRQISVNQVLSNQTINICDRKQAIYAKIKDDDMESVKFKNCSNVSIAWVEIFGRYQPKNAFLDDYPLLKLVHSADANKQSSIYINNIKINEFKIKLENEGIATHIDNGVLCCAGNKVKIFKTSSDTISIEAILCPEYFEIKNLLYDQFCVL